ncbi:MAG: hypothetical protein K5872_08755 [Rhizobiaceae bacterium]|nr:hypothetical protein [Rhizobiaceae bacterium]
MLDTQPVQVANRAHIQRSDQALANLRHCSASIDLLRKIAELHDLDSDDEIALRRLAVRLINSAGAAADCIAAGYYQPAASLIRDIIEVSFLCDLFRHVPEELPAWRSADDDERKKRFRPVHIRDRLATLDPANADARDKAYRFFSTHGTHLHPQMVGLMSPEQLTMIGPFPDEARSTHITFDLARFLGIGTACLAASVRSVRIVSEVQRTGFLVLRDGYVEHMRVWHASTSERLRYMPNSPSR